MRQTIAELIAVHRALIAADEALFDAHGTPLVDAETADASEETCRRAFVAMLAAPCLGMSDVSAKADYILNGTVGERQSLLSELTGPDGEDPTDPAGPLVSFLGSLLPQPHINPVPLVHGDFAGALAMVAPPSGGPRS